MEPNKIILIILLGCGFGCAGKEQDLTEAMTFSACQVGTYTATKTDNTEVDLDQPATFVDLRPAVNISQYLLTLEVGTPVQRLNLLLDTGSSDTVVQGDTKLCPTCFEAANGGPPLTFYNPFLSTTEVDTGKAIAIGYQAGSATTNMYEDLLDMGCDKSVKLQMPFLVITKKSLAGIKQGILGLAYAPLNKAKQIPFMDAITLPGLDIDNIFSMALCGDRPGSTVIFGNNDSRIDTSKLKWTPISKKAYYAIHAYGLYVKDWSYEGSTTLTPTTCQELLPTTCNASTTTWKKDPGKKTLLACFLYGTAPGSSEVIVDSGSTLNYLNINQIDCLNGLMKGVNQSIGSPIDNNAFNTPKGNLVLMDASKEIISQFPTLFITVENQDGGNPHELDMTPQSYFRAWTNGKYIFGHQKYAGLQILGDVFMENHYVIFDRKSNEGKGRIGFTSNDQICTP